MTLRRGFNRLFVAAFVCWNVVNLGIVLKKARESAALVNEDVRRAWQYCVSSKECPASAPEMQDTTARAHDTPKHAKTQDTGSSGRVFSADEFLPSVCTHPFPKNVDCDTYKEAVSTTVGREFKSRLADTRTLLYIEGIPAGIYVLCWAIAATFIWIARGFGIAGGEKRG